MYLCYISESIPTVLEITGDTEDVDQLRDMAIGDVNADSKLNFIFLTLQAEFPIIMISKQAIIHFLFTQLY